MESQYDIIVIGSGLSGLLNAAILSKEGYKVLVLEKNHIPGGCLQSFTRKGVVFDTGIHYVGSLDPGQQLYAILKFIGVVDKLKFQRLDNNAFDYYFLGEKRYALAQGFDNFKETLSQSFPENSHEIIKYVHALKSLIDSIPFFNFDTPQGTDFNIFNHLTLSLKAVLESFTSNAALANVLSAMNFLHGGSEDKTYWYVHAIMQSHYIQSAYRFVDGSQQLADALVDKIRENGGDVFMNKNVTGFKFEGAEISGVVLEDGEVFTTKNVIASTHPSSVMKMIPDDKIRKIYKKRLLNLRNTTGFFTVYLKFKEKKVPYLNSNYYYYDGINTWVPEMQQKHGWPYGFALFPVCSQQNQKYMDGASIMTSIDYKIFSKWDNTLHGRRGDEYHEFKESFALQLIDKLNDRMPGIKENIDSFYSSTPLSWRDYTGAPDGSGYGILREFGNDYEAFIYPKTHIKNLYLTGQSTFLHGAMGVSLGALLTVSELIGMEHLIQKIRYAQF